MILTPLLGQEFGMMLARLDREDLAILAELMQAGEVTPVIDRHYALSEVPEAIRYSEEGHARGKIIISMD
jgi:NADPH:quinone reductase-like Zn-dependent oxidoreductase